MSKLYEQENENVSELGAPSPWTIGKKSHGRISEAFWLDFLLIQATSICVANVNRHLPIHLDDFWVQFTKNVDESMR